MFLSLKQKLNLMSKYGLTSIEWPGFYLFYFGKAWTHDAAAAVYKTLMAKP